MHHYNFPPYSVGETGFMRGPKRRDIGHGALAERALAADAARREGLPLHASASSREILESNGSSSMASVCGSTLSLMDAGVPDQGAGGRHRHGPDQGGRRLRRAHRHRRRRRPPRRHGLQGRRHRPTASPPCRWTSRSAASPSRSSPTRSSRRGAARLFILGKMAERSPSRAPSSRSTRRASSRIQINPDQIGLIIGKGGETIKGMCRGVRRRDRHPGRRHDLHLPPPTSRPAKASPSRITSMTKEVEVGDIFTGRVVTTTDFGAFVELKKGVDGLIHISQAGSGQARRQGRGRRQAGRQSSPSRSSRSTRRAAASRSSRSTLPRDQV